MSYKFADDVADEATRTGRDKAENPFTEIVAKIALKKTKDDKPLAKSFVEEYDGTEKNYKLITGRVQRLLREAGTANEPSVSVPSRFEKVDDKNVKVKFWTVAKISRPRTAKGKA